MTPRLAVTVSVMTEVAISDFQSLREAGGKAFLDRFFSQGEQDTCLRRRRPDHGLAARYAARGGLRRACEESGLRPPASPGQAEIVHDAFGAPRFRLSGVFAAQTQGYRAEVSLAHDGDLASALVVLQAPAHDP